MIQRYNVEEKYVVVYYKNSEGGHPPKEVYCSKAFDRLSFPKSVSIRNFSPKEISWDYAIIEERYYRID